MALPRPSSPACAMARPAVLVALCALLSPAAPAAISIPASGPRDLTPTQKAAPKGSFKLRQGVRCNAHYHVSAWGSDAASCRAQCQEDERCASFSVEIAGDKGCHFFDSEAACSEQDGWVTGHKDTRFAIAKENSAATLACPFGMIISEIPFASYGTPTGQGDDFAFGSCHEDNTQEIVEDLCMGENSCTLSASSHVFGEPCDVVAKTLRVKAVCTAGPSFNEDVFFNAWSSRHWASATDEIESRTEEWKSFLSALPEYPKGKFSDKGIIVVAGGRYLEPAFVMLNMIRQSGCKLRIQVWHVGKEEMTDSHRELLRPYNVETRDFKDFVGKDMLQPIQANVGMRLFQLKPLALLHTDLEEVLLLDSDNVPVRDPSYLFDSKEFKETGTVFWPDYWKTSVDNPMWKILGQEPKAAWEQESGQLVLRKSAAWRAINLCVHFNSEFYMKLLNGDKDTFRFSWIAAQVPFHMIKAWPTAVGTLKELHSADQKGFCAHTMLQHDFDGKPLFVHHNQLKHASLEVGQNFKYQKVTASHDYRAVPVPGLKLASGVVLPCTDIQGARNAVIDEDDCTVENAGLEEFEVRYFAAQESLPANAFTAKERAAPSLLGSDDGKAHKLHRAYLENQQTFAKLRRDTNTTCAKFEFELVAPTVSMDRVCEPVAKCSKGQTEVARPTATSDRVCKALAAVPRKIFRVQVNTKSKNHPYFSAGSDRSFKLKDMSDPAGQYVEAPVLELTRLETYDFVMDNVNDADAFMITLDALGGPGVNAYETGVDGNNAKNTETLSFVPGPATPSMLYYQSGAMSHMGWRILIFNPTFAVTYIGQHPGNSGRAERFSTAFSKASHIFEHSAIRKDGAFAALRETCETHCASVVACKGIFIRRTAANIVCHGLNDVSGDAQATNSDSQSIIKQTR